MPLINTISSPRVFRLGIWRMEESVSRLESLLIRPEFYAEKVALLHPGSLRMREVLTVRCLLADMAGEELPITYDALGCPLLPTGKGFISISHTDGWASVLYLLPSTSQHPMHPGVDIERLGNRVGRVARRFLLPSELKILGDAEPIILETARLQPGWHDPARDTHPISIHLAWSAKETAFKILGSDYYDLQNKVVIVGLDTRTTRIQMRVMGSSTTLSIRYQVTPDYVLTFAALSERKCI